MIIKYCLQGLAMTLQLSDIDNIMTSSQMTLLNRNNAVVIVREYKDDKRVTEKNTMQWV